MNGNTCEMKNRYVWHALYNRFMRMRLKCGKGSGGRYAEALFFRHALLRMRIRCAVFFRATRRFVHVFLRRCVAAADAFACQDASLGKVMRKRFALKHR